MQTLHTPPFFSHETLLFPAECFRRSNFSSSRALQCSAERSLNVSKGNALVFSVTGRCISGAESNEASENRVWRSNHMRLGCSVSNAWDSDDNSESSELTSKRKVVEHICLLKAKDDLSEEQEKDMLDYLYTSQYQMGGIVAMSLGQISNQNPDGYTHAVFMRFQRREDLAKFYQNSSYLGVIKDHIMPYCHGLTYVDYESEVEDDILPIFRKGEDFNYGVEFMLLIAVVESALGKQIKDGLAALAKLTMELPALIVQSTQGSNLNLSDSEYTHAAVIRFRSTEAFKMFLGDSKYRDIWTSKFEPNTQKTLAVHFPVDPVGTEIM